MYSRAGWAWGSGVPRGSGGMPCHPAKPLVLLVLVVLEVLQMCSASCRWGTWCRCSQGGGSPACWHLLGARLQILGSAVLH